MLVKTIVKKIIYKSLGFLLLILFNIDSPALAESIHEQEFNENNELKTEKKESWWDWLNNNKFNFLILSGIIIIFGGIIFYTGTDISNNKYPIRDIFFELQKILPEEQYNQLLLTVLEMKNKPEKIKSGIELLKILQLYFKELVVPGKQSLYVELINKIIKYF